MLLSADKKKYENIMVKKLVAAFLMGTRNSSVVDK